MKSVKHLVIIGVLAIIFFGILVISTATVNVDENYNFDSNIEISSLDNYNAEFKVGSINIQNNGFFPARVELKRFVVCQISDYFGDQTYQVNYQGRTTYTNRDEFFSGTRKEVVDISAGDERILDIVPSVNSYTLKQMVKKYDLNGRTLPFYVFELEEESMSYYRYCDDVSKSEAYQVINVTINIPEEELADVKVY